SPRALRWAVNALLAAVVLLAAPVVYQGVTGSRNPLWGFGAMAWKEIVPGQFGWRLAGAMGDPNFLALVLVAALPLALMELLEQRAGWCRRARGDDHHALRVPRAHRHPGPDRAGPESDAARRQLPGAPQRPLRRHAHVPCPSPARR